MKKIVLHYINGSTKELLYEDYGSTLERVREATQTKKGLLYLKFLEGTLQRAYVDGELVIDREEILNGQI